MRTTLSLDDELLAAAKRRARSEGVSLGTVVENALRRAMARDAADAMPPAVPVFTQGTGPRPGVDLTSTRALHELLDDGADPLHSR